MNSDSLILGHATVKKINIVFAITNIFIISKPVVEWPTPKWNILSKIDWLHGSTSSVRLELAPYLRPISNSLQNRNSSLRQPHVHAYSHLLRRFASLPMQHSDDCCWYFYWVFCSMFLPFWNFVFFVSAFIAVFFYLNVNVSRDNKQYFFF